MRRRGAPLALAFALLALGPAGRAQSPRFESSRREIAAILASRIFKKYAEYEITGIRRGEGPGGTYFVTLEKPRVSPRARACLAFQSRKGGKWEPVGKEGDCNE